MSKSAGVRPWLVTVAVTAAVAAVPAMGAAQASAATLAVGKPCYVNASPGQGAQIAIGGTGFTPGDSIEIEGTGVFATATANAAGQILVATQGPILSTAGPGQANFGLTANDETTGASGVATTTVTMANLSVDTAPAVAKPSRTVAWHFSGFAPGRTIWVHYLRKGKVLTRVNMGKAKGACGLLTAHKKLYPSSHPKYTKYTVVIDQVKRYTKRAVPRISTTLSFF